MLILHPMIDIFFLFVLPFQSSLEVEKAVVKRISLCKIARKRVLLNSSPKFWQTVCVQVQICWHGSSYRLEVNTARRQYCLDRHIA